MKNVLTLTIIGLLTVLSSTAQNCTFDDLQYESMYSDYTNSGGSDDKDGCSFSSAMTNDNIGNKAIPFNVKDINGNHYTLEELKGQIVVINFWFIDCNPCTSEIPELNQMVEHFKNDDIVFLGMALDSEERLKTFLKTTPFDYNIIPKCKDIVTAYGIKTSPGHVVIDKNSQIVYSSEGLTPETVKNLQAAIEAQL
ncbi:peroxiredoxin family protein [Carboxylicivirga sp. RSCT41]|uniref:peroxiredoxin family protein n=1 Tax=Carboxylicivirga agarovorans TaxID=3417570 RepID=UPI003D350D07